MTNKIGDCVSKKIHKHKEIKLLCLQFAENIDKIIAESDDITQTEFELISNYYQTYNINKIDVQRRYSH